MVLALIIFILSIILIMFRPKPLNESTAAALGAFLMLATSVVTPAQAIEVLKYNANILLFFLGLMLVCIVADEGGFFEWSAIKAIGLAKGNGRKLFLIIFGLGAVITAFFSNDSTALILTPIVYLLVTRLKLNPLPYVFICAFIANTASIILPISNPVNILPLDKFGLTLGEYLRFLFVPAILATVINIGIFALIFRKDIPRSFVTARMETSFKVDSFFLFVCGGLCFTAIGYILALVYRLPLSLPALAGAVILLSGGFAFRRLRLRNVSSGVPWSILLFIFSLALLVRGLENTGITRILGEAITELAARGTMLSVVAITFLTAFGSNLINNWPMMMVSVSSLGSIGNSVPDPSLIYSAILGADLGPNIAILGSLSSMLWLLLLKQRGLSIHPLQYLKIGLIVTLPMLFVGALSIYATTAFK